MADHRSDTRSDARSPQRKPARWAARWLAAGALTAAAALAAPGTAGAQETIRVGAPLPLTGPLSPEGIKQQRGYDMWAEASNARGGIKVGGKSYKIEIVYVDYASNTPRAVQAAERLITEDKVNFLFSPFGSGAAKAASGVSEKYGIPTIAATASSAQVYDQGYKYLFGVYTPNETLTEPLADIVVAQKKDTKRVAILARNDLFPLAIAQEMEKSAKARKLEIVMFERYAIGTMDHAAAITQMRAARPDWVFATGYTNGPHPHPQADGRSRPQAGGAHHGGGAGLQGVHRGARPARREPFQRRLVGIRRCVTRAPTCSAPPKPTTRCGPRNTATSRTNGEASAAAAGAILQLGIEKAGSIDPAKVRDGLAALDTDTFYGHVKFGPNGQITSLQPPVFQIQNKKPVVIYPAAIKQGDLKLGVR